MKTTDEQLADIENFFSDAFAADSAKFVSMEAPDQEFEIQGVIKIIPSDGRSVFYLAYVEPKT